TAEIREGGHNCEMLTHEYVRKITEEASDDDHFTCGPWLSAIQCLAVGRITLKDLSGIISGTIHYKVLNDEVYGKAISVGAVLILHNVLVFSNKSSGLYLNITLKNVVKVKHVIMASMALKGLGGILFVIGSMIGNCCPYESQTLVLMQEDQISSVPISNAIDAESIPKKTHIKYAQKESRNDVLMSTNDRETTKEVVDELISSDKSITNGEHKDGNESTKLATSSEASNGYTSVSDHVTNQEGEVFDKPMFDEVKTRNDDAYRDERMREVIVGEPFCKASYVEARRFDGMIIIFNGNDNVTYQMVRSHPRFKHLTNKQCNKITPLLKVSEQDRMNEISHSYQKMKGFYKVIVDLGPKFIRDEKIMERLTRGHISVHEIE
nr:tyrosine-protein kinase, non-receptor Jak2 [Tanacetum cinerariifolium]